MERFLYTLIVMTLLTLPGCNRPADPGEATSPPAQQLQSPAKAAKAENWRTFAAAVVQSEVKDESIRPFTFVVPEGSDDDSKEQRQAIVVAVRGMLMNTALPGRLLAFTGPDSATVGEVIVDALHGLPGLPARGLTFLFIGTPQASIAASQAVRAAGGNLRLRPMEPSH